MNSFALSIFERLESQVLDLKATADRELAAGHTNSASACFRSGLVLAVAALDTYFHERGVDLLVKRAALDNVNAGEVVSYVGNLQVHDIQGHQAPGLLRLRLSYKTLVSPEKIDELLKGCGLDPDSLWLRATANIGSRPDRYRRLVQLQVDRRNQIAHEGDWDPSASDFRAATHTHLNDCVGCVAPLVRSFDSLLP